VHVVKLYFLLKAIYAGQYSGPFGKNHLRDVWREESFCMWSGTAEGKQRI
jgi:hypothetical protein